MVGGMIRGRGYGGDPWEQGISICHWILISLIP